MATFRSNSDNGAGVPTCASAHDRAFSLVELMIVMTLLTLIVLALMNVFSSTQRAFRASVTQTDVLEGSRAAMELITADIRQMTPSGDYYGGAVNFFSADNNYSSAMLYNSSSAMTYAPLAQSLPGGTIQRTNLLNYFFLLGRRNTKWIGIGYAVNVTNTASLYTLYRFYAETNVSQPAATLFNSFLSTVNAGGWTSMSPVLDGVFHLVVRPYNVNGIELPNGYNLQTNLPPNAAFYPFPDGNVGFYFFSNTVPAAVEVQLGVLEDRARARAQSLQSSSARANYLSGLSGSVHIFRQQVNIPNVDRSAYP